MECGRLSRPRHYRKGAQPVPKTVHRSGCRDKHNWPRPLTPQSIMPSLNNCDPLRHVGVNNLPKVVTRQRRGRELNSQLASCKSNTLATRLPSHPMSETHSQCDARPSVTFPDAQHCALASTHFPSQITNVKTIRWQWHNFFIPYLCQLFSHHDMEQALRKMFVIVASLS